MRIWLGLLLVSAVPSVALAEAGEPPIQNVDALIKDTARPGQKAGQVLPMKPTRRLRFQTRHATWASLDIAPDGKRIAFDMLGDVYTMPISGGLAKVIAKGMAFEGQPAFAPDGKAIAYVSDRSGAENLWIMRAGGKNPRQISFGDDDTVLVSPSWAPDGKSLYVSRYRPSLNAYELWRYDIGGATTLIVPIRQKQADPRGSWTSTIGAVASPDGVFLYAAQRTGNLDFDEVDQWTIIRLNLQTGVKTTIVSTPDAPRSTLNPGAFFRPILSPEGTRLAYGARIDGQTELRLRDLTSGADKRLAFPIEHDQVQAQMWQDILPRYAFTPDGSAIVIAVKGELKRIEIADGKSTAIAYNANVDLDIGPSTRQDIREDRGPVRARLIMAPTMSPNGRTLAFSALGRLYSMSLNEKARPIALAVGMVPTFQPSWSADGKRLTYVSWNERGGGAVWVATVDSSAPPTKISTISAYYSHPVFSRDGKTVFVVRSAQAARLNQYMEYGQLREGELVAIPINNPAENVIMRGKIGGRPQVADHSDAIYIMGEDGLDRVDLATGKHTLAAQITGPGWYFQDGAVAVDDMQVSPDGKWLLAQVAQQLHLVAMPAPGVTVDLSDTTLPHRRLTDSGADYFQWSPDGKTIGWSTGSTYHSRLLANVKLAIQDMDFWRADVDPGQHDYSAVVEVPRAVAAETLLLRGARVLTMASGDPLLPSADILVAHGRFAAVGPAGSLAVPAGTMTIDVTGKTILPGFIDTHDHIATVRRDVLGLEDWGLRARLAEGVTTSFDPSTLTIDMLAYQDMLDSGQMVGPRLRQTGVALFSMQRFQSLQETIAVIKRYRDDYGLRNIKEYRTGNRRVRQWVAMACRQLGMQPTTEGALSMKLDLSQIIDGFAGNEHALVAAPLQKDVIELLKFGRTSYTTTLAVNNGGPTSQDWSVANDNPHDGSKLDHFWPHSAIDQVMTHRPWRRLEEYRFPAIAADAAALQKAGGLVGIGSHGETPGIGFHYEMEAHAQGEMSAMAILHAATIGSAETIGRKSDLGSIEVGKIADLVILDQDPLIKIQNARAVVQVMRDGFLYDAATLDRVWPTPATLPPSWFARDKTAQWLPSGDDK